jgi:hypothetical protein
MNPASDLAPRRHSMTSPTRPTRVTGTVMPSAQVGRQRRQAAVLILRPPVFHRDVASNAARLMGHFVGAIPDAAWRAQGYFDQNL